MATLSAVHAIYQRLAGTFRSLRDDSQWQNLKIIGVISAGSGFLSDTLQPAFPLLSWLFPGAAAIAATGFLAWLRARRAEGGPTPSRRCLIWARATLCGAIATAVLAPVLVLNLAAGDRGAVAELSATVRTAQDYLLGRLDKIDAGLADLSAETRRGNESLSVLIDETKESNKSLKPVQQAMELSVALELLDRAKENRNGADQGQVQAISALIARNHSLSGENLSGVYLGGANFSGVDFSKANLHFANLSGSTFSSASLTEAGLRFAIADQARFENKTSLARVFAPFMSAENAHFNGADAKEANFSGADLRKADFSQAILNGAVFAFADLTDAKFIGATLIDADFTGARLNGVLFTDAVLGNTGMFGATRSADVLDNTQRSKLCRPELRDGAVELDVRLQARWPSTRFSSGYDYDIGLFQYRNYLRDRTDAELPLCSGSMRQRPPAPGFYPTSPGVIQMNLDTFYLDKAGRRQTLEQTMQAFIERIEIRQEVRKD